MINQESLPLGNPSTSSDTIKGAMHIIEGLRTKVKPYVRADENAEELALRYQRLELLEELATFKDKHLLAFIGLLCSISTETTSIEPFLHKLARDVEVIQPNNADWTVAFVKLCQARLSGNKGGVRL